MLLLPTEIFFFIVCIIDSIQREVSPVGENVCLQTETYQETTMVRTLKPKTVKDTSWCWSLKNMFRCDTTVTKWNYENKPQVFTRTKLVPKCCDGYEVEKGNITKCVPVCVRGCVNGKCVRPGICSCKPGYFGMNCAKTCPRGFWGENCFNECDCSSNGECDTAYGECYCQPGWSGVKCESPCQSGYYGFSCKNKCKCDDQLCNHINGQCITSTTTKSSFTEIDQSTSYGNSTTEPFKAGSAEGFANRTKEERKLIITPTNITIFYSTDVKKINYLGNSNETILKELTSTTTESYADLSTTESYTDLSTTESYTDLSTTENYADISTTVKILIKILGSNEPKTEDVYLKQKKIYPKDSSETFTENSDHDETKVTNEAEKSFESNILSESIENENTVKNFGSTDQNEYNNETDNFISERHGGLEEQTIPTFLRFLPTFSVLSGVVFITFITLSGWVIFRYQRKAKIMMTATTQKDAVFQLDEKVNHQKEDFFCVNNRTKSTVLYCNNYTDLSDTDFKNKTPLLRTFKPETADKSIISKETHLIAADNDENINFATYFFVL